MEVETLTGNYVQLMRGIKDTCDELANTLNACKADRQQLSIALLQHRAFINDSYAFLLEFYKWLNDIQERYHEPCELDL